MIITNTKYIPGKEVVEVLGIVQVSITPNVGMMKHLMTNEEIEQMLGYLKEKANKLNADAIINIRFEGIVLAGYPSWQVCFFAYGTAIKIKEIYMKE